MSGHDLYADDFPPHGTTTGYAAGCHSSGACPGKLERGQTCVQAHHRYASDWGYRKAVDAGAELSVLELATADVPVSPRTVPVARPKPPAPTPVPEELQQWPDDEPALLTEREIASSSCLAKSQGAFASHPKQRDHALATASEEHPMGLTLTGEPRRRCAPGTILVHGVLQAARPWPGDESEVAAAEQMLYVEDVTPVAPEPEPEPVPEPVEDEPAADHEPAFDDEEPRPRGKRVLDDAVRTLAESLELQRALAVIGERALRTIRIEINHLRREVAAHEREDRA
jgi:hypothetical protein